MRQHVGRNANNSAVEDRERRPAKITVLAWPYQANSSLNPYQYLLYRGITEGAGFEVTEFSLKRIFLWRWDIVHIHWPDGFWPRHSWFVSIAYSAVLLSGLLLARLRGARLVWTTHNISAHERQNNALRSAYMHAFTSICDGLINLSPENRTSTLSAYPHLESLQYTIVQHGLYDDYYPKHELTRQQCRERLNLPSEGGVLLALGNIRPYKGYDRLIEAFLSVPAAVRENWTLLIAGKSGDDNHFQELVARAGTAENIQVRNTFVPDEEIGLYFGAASLTALPYRAMQNSGVANLSLSFGTPVLAPDINSFIDLHRFYPEIIELFSGDISSETLAGALQRHAQSEGQAPPEWQRLRREISVATQHFLHKLANTE